MRLEDETEFTGSRLGVNPSRGRQQQLKGVRVMFL